MITRLVTRGFRADWVTFLFTIMFCLRFTIGRSNEGVELEELIVVRSFWWVESNTNQVVIMTGEGWGWVGFGSGVSKVECCIDPVEVDSACSNFLVDEFDWYRNVLDSCSNGIGFKSVDARLAVKVDW